MNEKTIGELCREYRTKHIISQTELAKRCGVAVATICKAERGTELALIPTAKIKRIVEEVEQ